MLTRISRFAGCGLLLFIASIGFAQTLDDEELIRALQEGGHILVMRHASSPRQAPSAEVANSDNLKRERQLDEVGRSDAIAMGASLRRLEIPIVDVESSPTYRALETAHLAGFTEVHILAYLGNQGMQNSSSANTVQLLEDLANASQLGNRLIVTHSPNLSAAFPELSPKVAEGETLIFDPKVSISIPIVRVTINRWLNIR